MLQIIDTISQSHARIYRPACLVHFHQDHVLPHENLFCRLYSENQSNIHASVISTT